MIELIWAHLADGGLTIADYPSALEQFFRYVVRTELSNQIAFTDYTSSTRIPKRSAAPIEILDPVNRDNNVASRYTNRDRLKIADAAQYSMSALGEAKFATTKGRAVDCWQSVLGPSFRA
jgi:hypothetical protein